MHEFLHQFIKHIITYVSEIGYIGIFIGMFIESTLIPIPSELIMIPAGLAVYSGTLNLYLLLLFGISGNVAGAVFSYYLAISMGRKIILKIGKFFFVKPETIIKIENFFKEYGSISIFIGRLLPGFRHFISLPAGLAKMDFKLFLFYTTLGSAIWTSVLVAIGYFIGENQNLIHQYLREIMFATIAFCLVIVMVFVFFKKRKIAK